MRHFDGKHHYHPLLPAHTRFDWVEITYTHGTVYHMEGPYFTRAEEELGREILSNFIKDQLKSPSPLGQGGYRP
jgi:hypothetical protein